MSLHCCWTPEQWAKAHILCHLYPVCVLHLPKAILFYEDMAWYSVLFFYSSVYQREKKAAASSRTKRAVKMWESGTGKSLNSILITANILKLLEIPCFPSTALRYEWFIPSEDCRSERSVAPFMKSIEIKILSDIQKKLYPHFQLKYVACC